MNCTEAASAVEAIAAYRRMLDGNYHSEQAVIDLRHYFPALAVAQAAFDTHLWRDRMAFETAHPQPPFDAMDVAGFLQRPTFGGADWSQWTRDAQRALETELEIALGTR